MSTADKAAIRALVACTLYDIERPNHSGAFSFYMIAGRLQPPVLEIGIRYVQRYASRLRGQQP